jgi:hypothetical protein
MIYWFILYPLGRYNRVPLTFGSGLFTTHETTTAWTTTSGSVADWNVTRSDLQQLTNRIMKYWKTTGLINPSKVISDDNSPTSSRTRLVSIAAILRRYSPSRHLCSGYSAIFLLSLPVTNYAFLFNSTVQNLSILYARGLLILLSLFAPSRIMPLLVLLEALICSSPWIQISLVLHIFFHKYSKYV